MKTSAIVLLFLAAFSSQAATSLESGEFAVDLREGPRVARASEPIVWSARWAADAPADATAVVKVSPPNDPEGAAAVLHSAEGEGTTTWTPAAAGLYRLTHETETNGVSCGEPLEAFFEVGGPSISLAPDGELVPGVGVVISGVGEGWTLRYTTDGSVPTANSPEYTGPFALSGSATVRVVAFSASGFASRVFSERFELHEPLSVSVAAVRQRYPWNGCVDVDATVSGDPSRRYAVRLLASDVAGGTNLSVRTVRGEGVAADADGVFLLAPGSYRFTWNADADLADDGVFPAIEFAVAAEPAGATDFRRRTRFETSGYAGTETLADVPVLVRISEALPGFRYADCGANGAGLVFCDEAETTVYPHEIDEWNPGGESLVWVRLPELKAGTAFEMGWGGTAAAPDPHAVWSDYAGVWHMNEDSGTAFDSTANGLDATPAVGTKGNASTLSEMAAYENGACGRARVNDAVDRTTSALTGSGNHLEVPSSAALFLGSSFTVSGWFHSGSMTNCPRVVSRKDEYRSDNGWEIQISSHPTRVGLRGASNSPTLGGVEIPDLRSGWVQLLADFEGSVVRCYTNGALAATGAVTPATDNNLPLVFGSDSDGTETTFHGQYDEIRLRGGTLSADRVRADYDIVADRGFLSAGAAVWAGGGSSASDSTTTPLDVCHDAVRVSDGAEVLTYSTRWAGADALAGCTRKARLEVAGYVGTETLADVPVLVRLSSAIPGFDYADFADGAADLVFCDEAETTVYPHEIDEWNTNGESLVWVRLPALAAGTAFKMGYGGSAASAADRAAAAHAVWTDYAGVWHMNEDSGTAFDSTANGLDAVPSKGTNSLSDVAQMIACEQGAVGRGRVNALQALFGGNHLTVPNYDSCGLGDTFVVSGWFHADSESQYYPKPFWRNWESGGWGVEFYRDTFSQLSVVGGGAGDASKYIAKAPLHTSVADGWSWICIAYQGTRASLYQNGSLVTNGTILAVTDNGNVLTFGGVEGPCNSTGFVGQYDEIRLRGGTLSEDRVRADYDIVANLGFVTCGAVETVGAAGTTVEIRLGGEVFADNLAGEGTIPWTATGPGIYEFEHVSLAGGSPVAVENATFVVPGPTTNDLSILAEGDLMPGVAIRLGGAADGWTLHYTTNGSTPTAESPAYTGPFALAESVTVKVVAVSDAHGWTSGVAEQRFDLAPPLAVTGARARQRYPWNGLVDVDFTLEGDAARRYRVSLEATDLAGGTNLALRTVCEDGGSVTNAALDVAPGLHRFVWNAEADLPAGFVADQVAIDVRAEAIHDTALYMVVDLSGGPDAERYPVSYLPDVPESGWTDEYKTDKLVLRRVEPGWFTMGSPEDEEGRYPDRESSRDVTLTAPLMSAVFETTQRQFELVAGTNCASFASPVKPIDNVMLSLIRGDGAEFDWPTIRVPSPVSFVGRVSHRSGILFDLPTEAQWEYVCRATTRSPLNSGGEGVSEYARLGRFNGAATGSNEGYAAVGEFIPNAWSIYDMHGNVYEWCLDWFDNAPVGNVDPVGPFVGEARVKKGGSWYAQYRYGRSAYRDPTVYGYNSGIGVYYRDVGFRLFLHNAPAVVEAPIVAPAGLAATTNRTGDVALSWEPVSGAYAYQIRRSKTGAFEDGTWLNTVTNTTYADWTAESRADYAYWVRAQFESGRVGQWSEAAEGSRHKYYSVHFNANGGTGTMVDLELRFNQPQALTANAFTKSGAVFAGWALSAGGSSVYADGETVENLTVEPGATVVLYAVWASSSYTVKFNKNASAASGTMADQTMTRNANAALRANAFVRAGYRFAGWATSASGAKVYNDKQSVKNITTDSSITLYAVWEALTAQNGLYMVIDLSGGANASSYPVSYLSAVPSGGWSTTYKTTKMVLRRINPGTFSMCGQYATTLTEPYYIGVFEVTEKQYKLITGTNPSRVSSYYTGDTLPVNGASYNMLRGTSNGAKWPASSAVDSSSTIGKLRTRTGMALDLPTEAQWEYACRAGTTTSFNNGGSSKADAQKVGCYEENAPYWDKDGYWGQRPNYVGSYKANAWGLYDMHGNLAEWCLDWYVKDLSSPQTDPKGPSSGTKRVVRGGTYYWHYYDATSSSREGNISTPGYETSIFGFRLSVTVK